MRSRPTRLPAYLLALVIAPVFVVAAEPTSRPADDGRVADAQQAKSFDVTFNVRYLLYTPPTYDRDPQNADGGDGKGWPLVLFLHGAGERGRDVNDVKRLGPPRFVADGRDFPFVLISPQCEPGSWWNADVLARLVDDAVRTMHVDPDRVYVTGLSMGGFGTWDLLRFAPDRFAAAVPICGGGDPMRVGPQAKAFPVWAFHGADDKVVPVERSVKMIEAFRAAGNPEAKLTIYPDVGHPSWDKAYADPAMWEWLLSHRRVRAATSAPTVAPTTAPTR